MRRSLFILGALLLTGSAAMADNPQVSPTCVNPYTTFEMVRCAGDDLQTANHQLNSTYHNLMKLEDNRGRKKLQAAQRDWLTYRDKHCAFEADAYRGGTLQAQVVLTCKANLSRDRIQQLQTESAQRKL